VPQPYPVQVPVDRPYPVPVACPQPIAYPYKVPVPHAAVPAPAAYHPYPPRQICHLVPQCRTCCY
jgi:hypothetical protein